jgi:hypothetical protein
MEFEPHDQDIITLLTKLKDVQGGYPENLFAARRQSYLKRMMEIELGMSGGNAIRNTRGNPKHPSTSPPAGTLLEVALIVAIVTEASVMAYFYRDKLADFVQTLTAGARAAEATPAPILPTSSAVQGITSSPALTSTAVAASPTGITGTPTSTPMPALVDDNSSSTTPGVGSTPDPNGNNGHHYGQTPKPQRTKENGNNDKPPKDDKPPKGKPTQKTK